MIVVVRLGVMHPERGHAGHVLGGNLLRELDTGWETHGQAPLADPELEPICRGIDWWLVAAVLNQLCKQVDVGEITAAVESMVAHVADGAGVDKPIVVDHETVHDAVAHSLAIATRLGSFVGSPARLVYVGAPGG